LDLERPIGVLSRLVVHPAFRRAGLARALTDARIEYARSWGARTVLSEAAPDRAAQLLGRGFVDLGQTEPERWEMAPFTLMALHLEA
jgi:GNAT superfamily N-acetyltransferase